LFCTILENYVDLAGTLIVSLLYTISRKGATTVYNALSLKKCAVMTSSSSELNIPCSTSTSSATFPSAAFVRT